MAYPTLKAEISFTSTPSQPDNWQNVTDYVIEEGTSIQRGRNDEFGSIQAGAATVHFINNDRRFDPDYASSPYYPNVRPMQRIRLSAVWNGDVYPLFVGYIQSWQAGRPYFGMATTIVQCSDALSAVFSQITIPESYTLVDSADFRSYKYDAISGSTFPLFIPMTSVRVYASNVTAGTFSITFDGTTHTYPYTITVSDFADALEDVFGIAYGELAILTSSPNSTLFTALGIAYTFDFYIGGKYTGVDLTSRIAVSLTGLTATARAGYATAPSTTTVPSFITNVAARDITLTVTPAPGAPGIYGTVYATIFGLFDNSRIIASKQIAFDNTNQTRSTPSVTYPFVTNAVFEVDINPPADTRNYGATLDVVVYNSEIASGTSGEMLQKAALYAGLNLSFVNADDGLSTLLAFEVEGANFLQSIQNIATSEGGVVFISNDGYLTFKDRASVASGLSLATFGNPELDADYLPYIDATPLYDERYILNSVTVTATGGDPQVAQDATSIQRYFVRTLAENNLLIQTDEEALNRARYKRSIYKEPQTRITNITHRGDLDPDNLWPILFGAELTNKYTVVYEPISGVGIPKSVSLENTSLRITRRDGWVIEWALSPTPTVFRADISLASGPDVVIY